MIHVWVCGAKTCECAFVCLFVALFFVAYSSLGGSHSPTPFVSVIVANESNHQRWGEAEYLQCIDHEYWWQKKTHIKKFDVSASCRYGWNRLTWHIWNWTTIQSRAYGVKIEEGKNEKRVTHAERERESNSIKCNKYEAKWWATSERQGDSEAEMRKSTYRQI